MSRRLQALAGAVVGMVIGCWALVAVAQEKVAGDPIPIVAPSWDIVTYGGHGDMRRTKIPGGWLVIIDHKDSATTTMVKDPNHDWLKPKTELKLEHDARSSYVAADKATFTILKPVVQKYIHHVSKNPAKSRIQKALDAWQARIAEAEKDQ